MFYVYYDFQQQINYQSPTIVPSTTRTTTATSFTQLLQPSSSAEFGVQSYCEQQQQLFQQQATIQQLQQQQQQTFFNPLQLQHQQQQPPQLKRAASSSSLHLRSESSEGQRAEEVQLRRFKRVRLEGTEISTSSVTSSSEWWRRQVRIINTPEDVSLREIFRITDRFGPIERIEVENISSGNKTREFLVTMTEVASAQALVNFYSERPTQLRDRVLYFQLATPEQSKSDMFYHIYRNPNSGSIFQTTNPPIEQQHANIVNNNNNSNNPNNVLNSGNGAVHVQQQQQQQFNNNNNVADNAGEVQKTVLRVVIENMFYQVSLDNLKQIFSKFGSVTKIITFSKNNAFQALIQYSEATAAQSAKTSLNGQCIFPGCCTMRVDYSKLPSLNVRYNNEKSRDYTDSSLPSGDISPVSFGASPVLYHPASLVTPAYTTTVNIPGIGPALAYCAPTQANLALPSATSCLPITSLVGVRVPWSDQMSPVLLVTNLHEELVTPDALFTLFGVYGDVVRVKIMFNKKDNALVQFVDGAQAQIALTHLDKVTLWGKVIKVALSKHCVVQMPKEGQPDSGLTKDYTNSTLHRFKKPNSKNYNNIYPPSATLHLSNIPPTTTEKQLVQLFAQYGCILGFKFFETDHKMALIQMGTVEEAVISLIKLHNYQLAETSHLRVSFSKSTITSQHSPSLSSKSAANVLNCSSNNNNDDDDNASTVQQNQFIMQ